MATRQPLYPSSEKQYQIVNNFNKGYDTNTYDGLLQDNVFREMENFDIREEGIIDKSKGLEDSGIMDLIKYYFTEEEFGEACTDPYSAVNWSTPGANIINDIKGSVSYTASTVYRTTLLKHLFDVANHELYEFTGYNYTFTFDKVLNFKVLEDTLLTDFINNGKSLKKDSVNSAGYPEIYEGVFDCLFILGSSSEPMDSNYPGPNTFKYIRVTVHSKTGNYLNPGKPQFSIRFDIHCDDFTGALDESKYLSNVHYNNGYIPLTEYNNYYYMPTGFGIFRIDKEYQIIAFDDSEAYTPNSPELISSDPYRPSAIELTNIGFNIMASSPITWYDSGVGTVDSIKGVFFTYDGEPVNAIPSGYTKATDNKVFEIHVITTGTGTLSKPQYRLDNGDFDTSSNPYADIPGSYTGTVFTVSDFNLSGKYEIKIEKGTAEPYIGYYTAKPIQVSETNKIDTIRPLLFNSLYCKVINSQLVLFGGHGYVFFSEFDNFKYFPNFYNLYAVDSGNDEVVNIKYFRQYNAIFTKKKLLRLAGTFGSDTFGLYPLNEFVGCINPHTIRQIQNTLYFVSEEGLFKLKQGYTGEGTENVEQIDISIKGDYDPSNVKGAFVKDNEYIMFIENETEYAYGDNGDITYGTSYTIIKYNFNLDAFTKRTYITNEDLPNEYFEYLTQVLESDTLIEGNYSKTSNYIVKTLKTTIGTYDYTLNYKILNYDSGYIDDGEYYVSKIKNPKLFWGMPTNNKKFKKVLIKSRNNGDEAVPVYVTATIDDIDILTPEYYVIRIGDDDNYVYYEKEENPNGELVIKEGSVLGELVLGSDSLGVMRTQDLGLDINAKGKCISLTIEDRDNDQPFSISDIGFVFRVKKPKKDR